MPTWYPSSPTKEWLPVRGGKHVPGIAFWSMVGLSLLTCVVAAVFVPGLPLWGRFVIAVLVFFVTFDAVDEKYGDWR